MENTYSFRCTDLLKIDSIQFDIKCEIPSFSEEETGEYKSLNPRRLISMLSIPSFLSDKYERHVYVRSLESLLIEFLQ